MRSIAGRAVLAMVAVSAGLVLHAQSGQGAAPPKPPGQIMATRLYAGEDGMSHVEQISVDLMAMPGAPPSVAVSQPFAVAKSYAVRLSPGFFEDWHTEEVRRYVVPISGRALIDVGDGGKHAIEPGHLYLVEDLTGKGHTFRVDGKEDWVAMFVDLGK